jgi:Ca-activated chloride channel family protein
MTCSPLQRLIRLPGYGRSGCKRAGAIPRCLRPNLEHDQPSSLLCTHSKALTATLMFAFLAQAQISIAPPPPSQDEVPVFTAGTRLVVVHASVLGSNRKLITNLPQSAFKVLENGVEQPIKVFRREDVPVSMGIVIDKSGSMRDSKTRVIAAALDLVRASNPQDEVFIVTFNDHAHLDQSFTSDMKKLEKALDGIETGGGTAMRDAVSMSIDYMKSKGKKDKKVLVTITDGNDNNSNLNVNELVRKSQQGDVLIYSIGILGQEEPSEARRAKRALHELAIASGGMDYYPKDAREVGTIIPRVAREIRNQYTLAYRPGNPALDGTFRKILVVVGAPGRPTVRSRNGYYANADRGSTAR